LIKFFEDRGLKLKIERQLRVFPLSNKASSILGVLEKELQKNKVNILYQGRVKDIIAENNQIKGLLLAGGKTIPADRVILATGGVSYSFTGSSGDGIKIAEKWGHHIIPLRQGLVPLETKQKYPAVLKGLTLKNIQLKFSDTKREIISPVGELLFTGFGISGPLVLSLSGRIVDWLNDNRSVFVDIDLKPGLSSAQLEARLLREIKLNPKKTIKNFLKTLLPKKLIDIFMEILKIIPQEKVNQITQAERRNIVSLLKAFRLDIAKALPIEEAMVTKGGVSLKDINPRTMESRLVKGLYFAGEMIDVDADTGGFNLQAAFSTGYLAGESAALN
jgi:predicted Rossmann fold flavoprotein